MKFTENILYINHITKAGINVITQRFKIATALNRRRRQQILMIRCVLIGSFVTNNVLRAVDIVLTR